MKRTIPLGHFQENTYIIIYIYIVCIYIIMLCIMLYYIYVIVCSAAYALHPFLGLWDVMVRKLFI